MVRVCSGSFDELHVGYKARELTFSGDIGAFACHDGSIFLIDLGEIFKKNTPPPTLENLVEPDLHWELPPNA